MSLMAPRQLLASVELGSSRPKPLHPAASDALNLSRTHHRRPAASANPTRRLSAAYAAAFREGS